MLAEWLYGRIPILFRAMMAKSDPEKNTAELNALAIEHLVHMLPGSSEEMVRHE
jgi:hypothetical protein